MGYIFVADNVRQRLTSTTVT